MSARPVLLALAAVLLAACASLPAVPDEAADRAAIEALLEDQQAAWNAGDIPGFMAGYWQDERLRFASGGRVSRGHGATLAGYLARYPDAAAMGRLTFSALEIERLSPDAAVVHGRWALERQADRPSGLFTLILRRQESGWRITSDTTTAAQ